MRISSSYIWTILPREAPTVSRYCRGCRNKSVFFSSEKFRVNGNQKVLDIWLIYKCQKCDQTWNREILSRMHVNSIDPHLLKSFRDNCKQTAIRYGSDTTSLRYSSNDVIWQQPDVIITHTDKSVDGLFEIFIEVKGVCQTRIDQLLAVQLKIPRTQLVKKIMVGEITCHPMRKKWHCRSPVDGQRIVIKSSFAALLVFN